MVFFVLLCVLKVSAQQEIPPWGVALNEVLFLDWETQGGGVAIQLQQGIYELLNSYINGGNSHG